MFSRDSGLSHHTRNSMMGCTGIVFENPPAPETKFSVLTRNCRETWKWIETRNAEFDTTNSTIFLEARCLELNASHWRKLFSKCTMEVLRYAISDLHSANSKTQSTSSARNGKSTAKAKVCANTPCLSYAHNVVDQ